MRFLSRVSVYNSTRIIRFLKEVIYGFLIGICDVIDQYNNNVLYIDKFVGRDPFRKGDELIPKFRMAILYSES